MIALDAPKVALVPFSYPDYPREVVNRFIDESKKMVSELGIDVVIAEPVIEEKDVEKAREKVRKENFDLIIALLVSWVEAPNLIAVLRDFFKKPILLWSHTTYKEGKDRITLGAIPAAGVIRQTLEEMEANFKFTYGMPTSRKVKEDIASFAQVSRAIRLLSDSRIGLFGYLSMGMYTGGFDHTKLRKLIGPEVIHLGQYYIIEKAEGIKDSEIRGLVDKAKEKWELSKEVDEVTLTKVMKVYLALKKLTEEYNLDALTVKCQYELSRLYKITPCVPLSMLGEEVVSSCEGDMPLAVSQLILHYLSGGKIVTYGDVHDVLEDNSLILAACGFAPLSLLQGKPKIAKHTALYEGLLNTSPYKEGRVTLARLASDGEGYKMHIATGEAKTMPSFHEIDCPSYAGMKVILSGDVHSFMQNIMSQHYAVVYGNFKDELLELARLLKIRVVN